MAFITKTDLKISILIDELNQIVRDDNTVIEQAISAAESKVKGYLYDSYDTDEIFSQTGADRHALLVQYCVDIAVYALVAATQAGQDVDDRKARHDRACKWLEQVRDQKNYVDLPLREATEQTHVFHSSLPRRSNHY